MVIAIDGIPVSGSIGHNTFARNRAGAYTRRRTKPVNPSSTLQQQVRAAMGAAVNAWTSDLLGIQRSGWNTYAAGVPWLNRAGQAMTLTGQNAFVRWYTWYLYWNATAPADVDPPAVFNIGAIAPEPETLGMTYDISANTLAVTCNFPLFSNLWQIENALITCTVSQPSNASRSFRPNRFRKATMATVAEIPTPAPAFTTNTSPWVFQTGQIAWAKFVAVTPDHQQTIETLVGPCTVTVVA